MIKKLISLMFVGATCLLGDEDPLSYDLRMNVAFLRHGETAWSWKMLAYGPKDLSLTSQGAASIYTASKIILDKLTFHPKLIIASPHKRCLETAEIFKKEYKKKFGKELKIVIIDELQAIKFGSWSNEVTQKLLKDIESIKKLNLPEKKSYKLMIKAVQETPQHNKEDESGFEKRCRKAFDYTFRTYGTDVVFVASGSVGKVFEEYLDSWVTLRDKSWLTYITFGRKSEKPS